MESELLFDPGGEHTYEDEDWSNECGLPDTFDEGRYLDDVPLPEKMSSRSEENEDGVVSKSPKTAVRTKAVQLNLNESMNISKKYQILPYITVHVYATESRVQVIQTKAADTSTKMQTGSTTRQAMKIYIKTEINPRNVKLESEPEKR